MSKHNEPLNHRVYTATGTHTVGEKSIGFYEATARGGPVKVINPSNKKLNFCTLGTFSNINWEQQINVFLSSNHANVYWLPWGDRVYSISIFCNWLVRKGLWHKKSKDNFEWFQARHINNRLKFFHYRSQAQTGMRSFGSCIKSCYIVDSIILAEEDIEPKISKHSLLQGKSVCWLGITDHFQLENPRDFSDFNLLNLKTGTTKFFDAKEDTWRIYKDMVIVQHFKHTDKQSCNCLQCR